VAELTEIIPVDPIATAEKVTALQRELTGGIQSDLVSEYTSSLRQRFPVEIDRTRVERLF
jgi:hypothetical protein